MKNILSKDNKNLFVIGFITLMAYINIFRNHFIMGDFSFIVDWPLIKNLWNLPRFFAGDIPPEGQIGVYSPLRTLIFAVNYALFDLNRVGYHLFSLIVHFMGIYFVYRLTLLLTGSRRLCFLTALFFGLHPVHGESVTSMTGSVDTVGIVLLFASFYFYIKSAGHQPLAVQGAPVDGNAGDMTQTQEKKNYLTSLVLAFLAIFTHELALMLPFLFLFYDGLFRGKVIRWREIFLRNLPFWAMAVFYVAAKTMVLGSPFRGHYLFHSFYLSMLVMIKVLSRYVWVSFFPFILAHDPVISRGIFSFDEKDFDSHAVVSQSILDAPVLVSLLLLAGIVMVAVKSYRKRPLISFCIGWFFLSLLPVMQIVPSSVFYAERYLYPGSWTACLLLSLVIERLFHFPDRQEKAFGRFNISWSGRRWGMILAVIMILFYGTRTAWRNTDYYNEATAYESAIRTNPFSAAVRNDLGLVYVRYESYDKAIESIEKAIELKPQESHYYFTLAQAYYQAQQYQQAIQALEKAIVLTPDFAEAYYNLASIYGHEGNEAKAMEYLDKGVEKYKKQNRILEAGEFAMVLKKSLKESPSSGQTQNPE